MTADGQVDTWKRRTLAQVMLAKHHQATHPLVYLVHPVDHVEVASNQISREAPER